MQTIDLAQMIQNVNSARFVVLDRKISQLYRNLRQALSGAEIFYLDEPESQKNLDDFKQACEFFLERNISRDDELIVIGGGATSDFGGFVAASLLRGIKWKVYPTTILAMVDAAIGGKVGVNCEHGKNLIGSFHQPEEIYLCAEFLSTLPKEEIISGQGEIIKYAFLSEDIFKMFEYGEKQNVIMAECARFKEGIVAHDFKESGKRKILNLGHTFGHCIEKQLQIPHGVAVMIGLKLIINLYAPKLQEKFNQIMNSYEFNFDLPTINFEQFCHFLQHDKKTKSDGTIDLIIPKDIGDIEIVNFPLAQLIEKIKNYSEYETFFS